MKKKIGIISVFTIFLISLSVVIPFTFAQEDYWNYCKISAYVTNLDDYSSSSTNTFRYQFTIAEPPAGSNITNTIEVRDDDSGVNYTKNLSIGDVVYFDYANLNPTKNYVNPAEESNYFIVDYEGEIYDLQINNILIPEFSPIFISPIFIIATLLAIIYRRKRIR
ncbi:MAG: hypothetical protein P8X47_12415 [Ignavibacteriaceae bacterium]